ncbi:MAG: cysteine synthase family protein [Acidobacteria bacterium]|nr:cysteine synthase family protein [Acidobacteriota bacterium]
MPDKQKLLSEHAILRLIGNTPLLKMDFLEEVPRGVRIYAKAEFFNPGGSIKDRPVLRMMLEAIESGELSRDKFLLDSTSGNAGISYAMIGAILGYRVQLVMPDNASEERKRRILGHGAQVIFTDPLEGYDAAIYKAEEIYRENPSRFFRPDQYSNDFNWIAHYETTGEEILRQTPEPITHFVGGVGTGGTLTGVGRRLKEHDRNIRVCVIYPDVFPGIEGLKPLDSPTDLIPKIYDRSVVDEILRVNNEDAYQMCQRLARHGLFVGQSSGAFMKGALDLALRIGEGVIVTALPDTGERYFSTPLWRT